jgi:hypothetical protein
MGYLSSIIVGFAILLLPFLLFINPRNPGSGFCEKGIVTFLIFSLFVSLDGVLLSLTGQLGNPLAWAATFFVVDGLLWSGSARSILDILAVFRKFFRQIPILLTGFLGFVLTVYLVRGLFTNPYNWDSLTCHIPRAFYYLNAGKYMYLGSPYWAQEIHPINYSSLQILLFHIFGTIKVFNLISYFSMLVFWIQTYVFLRFFSDNRSQSFLFSSVLWFCVNTTVSLASTQNDSYLAPILFGSVLSYLQYKKTGKLFFLGLAFLSFMNALGVKQTTFLIALSWLPFLLGGYELFKIEKKEIAVLALILPVGVAVGLFSYFKNYLTLGSFAGFPDAIKTHGSLTDVHFMVYEGPKNLLRYLFDFFSFDGLYFDLPSQLLISKITQAFKMPVYEGLKSVGLDLATGKLRDPFFYTKPAGIDDSRSFYGLFGVMIYIPILLFGFFYSAFVEKSKTQIYLILTILAFFLINSLFSTYDQGRCRHFIHVLPFVSAYLMLLSKRKAIQTYLTFAFILSAVNVGMASVFDRKHRLAGKDNLFNEPRFNCVKENRNSSDPVFEKMEKALLPYQNIALRMPENSVEIFYFGKDFTKNPRHFFSRKNGAEPISPDCEVLLYCTGSETTLPGDQYIGELNKGMDIYLRKLK